MTENISCPGCALLLPTGAAATYTGYYNTSAECWALYTEVLGSEFSDVLRFASSHQLTVDTYAVQHAGGPHPDTSIGVHLSGLHLMLEMNRTPISTAPLIKRLADSIEVWPHFDPPSERSVLTVFDVAMTGSPGEHAAAVRQWSESVWRLWADYHQRVADLVERTL
jgi:hypothetical protein